MKVLSDKTARRLIEHLDASGRSSRATPRGAATTPPANIWQIHVIPSSGIVSIDHGYYYHGGEWHESPATEIGQASGGELVVATADNDGLHISLCDENSLPDGDFRVIGKISGDGELGFGVRQYESGPLWFGSADHWGETEPLVELPADGGGDWRAMKEAGAGGEPSAVAESALVDIELDDEGRVTARHYRTRTIDAKGNVVAISDRAEDDADPDPGAPDAGGDTPPCGHPLNADDDYHPLAGGGASAAQDDDDSHPLDHEGPGGYTPNCKG